jgi:hypothetical protein
MTRNGINADVQDLGIQGGELFASRIEFRHLLRSGRRPVERVERNDEVLLPEIITQPDSNSVVAGNGIKLKCGRLVANSQWQAFPPFSCLREPRK